MRKFCLKIHRWFALPLGLIMAVLCFSGLAILLIKDIAPLFDMNAKELPIYTAIVRLHRWLTFRCCHLVAKDQEGFEKSFDRQHEQRVPSLCLRHSRIVRNLCCHLPSTDVAHWSRLLVRLVQSGYV